MSKPKLIVVDDEIDILDIYTSLLEPDFEVEAFNSPKEFLAALQADPHKDFELLITDLKMPEIDGLQMITQAQALGFSFPFILLSGHMDKAAAIDAINLGAFRRLEKPTAYEVLIAAIDQLIMEHEIVNVRKEIRAMTGQLRELYTSIRIIMDQYIPEDILNRLVVETNPDGQVKNKTSFESVLEKLETRLERLLESERVLTEMKVNKFKS